MKRILLVLSLWLAGNLTGAEPVKLIFDTDITGDVDDVLADAPAVRELHRGEEGRLGVDVVRLLGEAARLQGGLHRYQVQRRRPGRSHQQPPDPDQRDVG